MKRVLACSAMILAASCGPGPDNNFELRSQCSALATTFEQSQRSIIGAQVQFTNHYNANDRRCYVELNGIDKDSVLLRNVLDAQEHRVLVRCLQYKGKATCDQNGKALKPADGAALANKLMEESRLWPQ